jgi:arsenate reductase
MADLKVYLYTKCSTCRNASQWLADYGITHKKLAIRETPPSVEELHLGLKTMGSIRKLLNTSSQDYRDLGLKDKLDDMEPDEVFSLMQENGNLVKRPYVVSGKEAWAGFKPDIWAEKLT